MFIRDRLKKVAPATVLHHKRALSMIVTHAIRRGDLVENVVKRVRWPRAETKEMAFIPMDEASARA